MIAALSDYKPDTLLTTKEAGAILRKHPNEVASMCASGRLVAIRLGARYRIRAADLGEFIDRHKLRPLPVPSSR